MADYFTKFSLLVPLPTEAAEKQALEIVETARSIKQDDESCDDFPDSLRDAVDDWNFETEVSHDGQKWGLWLHSENGGIDAVCDFIQYLLQQFEPTGHVTLEWSSDCSKPRTDAFGGGAAFITATEIASINTGEWLHQQVAKLKTNPRQQSLAHH